MNKIKLVQIIADSKIGGGPNHILGILRNIDKEKFDCFLICPKGFLSDEAKKIDEITVINVEMKSKFDLKSVLQLREELQEIKAEKDPFGPMIVHSHGPRAGFISRLISPIGAKLVYTEHLLTKNYRLGSPLNYWLQKKIISIQNQKTDLIIAVSSSVKDYLVENNLAPSEKMVVINNAIELADINSEKKVKSANKAPIIGTVGSLNVQKGQEYLIEAMSLMKLKYPLATLEIIGDGPLKNPLKLKAKELGIERNVSFLGYKENIEKYIKHWDVFVLPSVSETFGIVVLEAMRAGVPVVASNVGGVKDIITNNVNGILVKSKNPKEIANAALKIIGHPALAAKMKRSGKERVRDFSWQKKIKELENSYLGLFF
ncbi:MAG: glycosyltransferase family 4 protein [Patescibacteria group bacterium]|nr:glycosyltransferase family 4 protein [Patescibacteria group bacterium]